MDLYDVIRLNDRLEENGVRKASFQTCEMVCSSRIDIELEGDIVRKIQYTDGCHGRGTSCPDQLARALKSLKSNHPRQQTTKPTD